MTGLAVPVVALISGWGWVGLVGDERNLAGRLAGATALAAVLTGGWLALLDLCGIPWRPSAMAAGWLPGVVLALLPVLRQLPGIPAALDEAWNTRRLSPWAAIAAAGVGARAVVVATVPAFGWDFRYIWGLKARVFAMAYGHDLRWLARPVHAFARPGYPPLWSDLVASGLVAGTSAGRAAAGWGALLAVGIGAACWRLARPAGRPIATLAALAGAWFPTLLAPDVFHSGSAEPLAAFLFAVALLALGRKDELPGSPHLLAAALASLAVTKNEGGVLALLVLVCFLRRVDTGRRVWVALATVGPLAVWQAAMAATGIPREAMVFHLSHMVTRAAALPSAVAAAAKPALVLEIVLVMVVLTAPAFPGVRPLKAVLFLWLTALASAYLLSPYDLVWHVQTSLERVMAIPLPGALALVLGTAASQGSRRVPPGSRQSRPQSALEGENATVGSCFPAESAPDDPVGRRFA